MECTGRTSAYFHGPAPEWLSFVGPEIGTTEKVSSGFHRRFKKRRGDLKFTPLKSVELSEMARVRSTWKLAKADGTAQQVRDSWKHWLSFCKRFNLEPIRNPMRRDEHAAAASQVQRFALYELARFKITTKVVNCKINQVGDYHIKS